MSDSTPLFGELLVQLGLCTPNQVQEALVLQTQTGQRVGEALVALGYVTRDQLEMALMEALGLRAPNQAERPRIGELLIRLKHITAQQLEAGLLQQRQSGRRLGEVLVELGACTYAQVYEALRLQQVGNGREEQKPPAKSVGQLRVLVVDDSSLALGVVQSGLEERGYDVHCFGEPFEALEAVFRIKPDIVLSDLDMPGMSGADLCRRLKDGPARAVPVIILTANDREAERVGGLRAGADDYVSKGASMDELAARIESVARRTGETERMRKLFARYTSAAVVEEILKAPGEIVLTGEKREVTLLFADIRNFTSMSETLPAEQVVDVLNAVLGRLAEAVLTCGGTLDKFLGDGLMAVFGAPVTHSDDALRALQSARMMMQAVVELNEQVRTCLTEKKSPYVDSINLQLGIGINTGMVVAGNLGSAQRTEYTCIGDAVNVAARLCAVAGPGEVLVGQRTYALAPGAGLFEELPPVRLKGKAQPVPLFRLLWSPSVVAEGSTEGVG